MRKDLTCALALNHSHAIFKPAFMHLAFSLAFAAFIFAEYIRYYALYPFGATLHVFLAEFTDHKDSGPVILSHFYLLTGCAGPLWIEGSSQITQQIGVLVLGVGDALASIVGRRYGRMYWPGSSKTVEGSVAFVSSVLGSTIALRVLGWVQPFSVSDEHDGHLCALADIDAVNLRRRCG